MRWHWRQLDHMLIVCTLLQTDNHTSTLYTSVYLFNIFISWNVLIMLHLVCLFHQCGAKWRLPMLLVTSSVVKDAKYCVVWRVLRWRLCNTVLGQVLVVSSKCLQLGWHAQHPARNVVCIDVMSYCISSVLVLVQFLLHGRVVKHGVCYSTSISVCLSVCLSVVLIDGTKMTENFHCCSRLYWLLIPSFMQQSDKITFVRASITDEKIFVILVNVSLKLRENYKAQSHIECHCCWCWVNVEGHFCNCNPLHSQGLENMAYMSDGTDEIRRYLSSAIDGHLLGQLGQFQHSGSQESFPCAAVNAAAVCRVEMLECARDDVAGQTCSGGQLFHSLASVWSPVVHPCTFAVVMFCIFYPCTFVYRCPFLCFSPLQFSLCHWLSLHFRWFCVFAS